jgi:hypothetical protein
VVLGSHAETQTAFVNATEVQFGLRGVAKPADRDTFEEFLIWTLQ